MTKEYVDGNFKNFKAEGQVKIMKRKKLTSCLSRSLESRVITRCCKHSGQFLGSRTPRKATIS